MLGGTIAEKVSAAEAAGFDVVELGMPDVDGYSDDAEGLSRLRQDLKLPVMDLQLLTDFDGACDARRRAKRVEAMAMLDTAVSVGAEMVIASASSHPDCIPDRVDDDVRWLARQAAERRLRVGYEPTAYSTFNSTLPSAWQCIRRVHEPNLGLVVDVFHVFVRGRDESDLDGIRTDRIFLVQLSDLARSVRYEDIPETARRHRLLPGQGHFPLQSMLERLRSDGYAGPIGLEVFNDELLARDPALVAHEGMSALVSAWVR